MFPFARVIRVQSSVGLVWGALLLLAPGVVLGLLGATTDAAGLVVARLAGGTWFALGATLTASWDSDDPAVRRRLAVLNGATSAAIAMTLFGGAVGGVTHGVMAWMAVVFFSVATVSWFGTLVNRAR